jgi:anti-sigma factor RsiW
MTTDDAHDLTGAYAVYALDREEREAFRRHCADCPDCARETVRQQEAAAWLALAAARTPPPRLKVRVLAEVARTPQLPPALQGSEMSAAAGDPGHG